ncbi:hypothetical protein EJ07DRAFT_159592 [Lizonia empirigonia]|nr:hypothetical protein EJ07DRAFT_159592 [Lizonia empirigonia]
MPLPNLTLATPPFRLTRHTHALSHQPLSTTTAPSFPSPSPSRPSTSSTNTSFTTAFSTLEASSPFRYYLPHISTCTSPVYTKNESYACNTTPASCGVGIDQVGLFYQYIPGESTAEKDVYTDGFGAVEVAEQKVLGELKDLVFDKPRTLGGIGRPLSLIGMDDFAHDPVNGEGGGIDVGSYTAGEKLDLHVSATDGRGGETKKQRKKVTKDRERESETLADVSKKVVRMMKKLHFGKKTSK